MIDDMTMIIMTITKSMERLHSIRESLQSEEYHSIISTEQDPTQCCTVIRTESET